MKIKLRLIWLSFKNMKLFYFVPLVFLFLYLPYSNWLDIKVLGEDYAFIRIMDSAQTIIPVFSTWWVFCILKEHLEGDGNELLYTYRSLGKTRIKEIVFSFIWYTLHMSLLFEAYSFIYGTLFLEFVRVLLEVFIFVSVFYFFIYLFRSAAAAYMLILIYYFMTVFFAQDTVIEYISIFSKGLEMSGELFMSKYVYLIPIGVIFFVLGWFFNKRYLKN